VYQEIQGLTVNSVSPFFVWVTVWVTICYISCCKLFFFEGEPYLPTSPLLKFVRVDLSCVNGQAIQHRHMLLEVRFMARADLSREETFQLS